MKPDHENPTGEFLLRFYRKRTASFLANIYKAGITGEPEDIHKARLDAKKIVAFLNLMEIVSPKTIKQAMYRKLFKKLFKTSGKIREIQVNLSLLDSSGMDPGMSAPFNEDLVRQEKERTAAFLDTLRRFDEKGLALAEERIRRTVMRVTPDKLKVKSGNFIQVKLDRIRELASGAANGKALHRIRRQLKELSAMISLTARIDPLGTMDYPVKELDRTEVSIGRWHDKVVLAETLEVFLESAISLPLNQQVVLAEYHRRLSSTNRRQMKRLLARVNAVIPGA